MTLGSTGLTDVNALTNRFSQRGLGVPLSFVIPTPKHLYLFGSTSLERDSVGNSDLTDSNTTPTESAQYGDVVRLTASPTNQGFTGIGQPSNTSGPMTYAIILSNAQFSSNNVLTNSGDADVFLSPNAATNIRVQGNTGSNVRTYTVPTMLVDTFYSVILTVNGSQGGRIYLDATESSSGIQTLTGGFSVTDIGDFVTGTANDFLGDIAEIAVFDYELSAAQVTQWYNSRRSNVLTTDKNRYEMDSAPFLVNEVDSTNPLSNTDVQSFIDDEFLEFGNFVTTDNPTLQGLPQSIITGPASWRIRMNPNDILGIDDIFFGSLASGLPLIFITSTGTTISIRTLTSSVITFNVTLANATWFDFVLTRDGSDFFRVYIDGIESSSGAKAGGTGGMAVDMIGGRGDTTKNFDGGLSDCILYPFQLSDAEVAQIAAGNIIPGFIARYKMLPNALNVDSVEGGADLVNTAVISGFNRAQVGLFNGTSAFFGSAYTGNSTGAATWAGWFNKNDVTQEMIFGNSGSAIPFIVFTNSTSLQVRTTENVTRSFTVPTMFINRWYFLVVTRDSSNNFRVFLNTVESTTGAINDTGTLAMDLIGRRSSGPEFWNGELDDLIYYDFDLSQAQITALFAGTLPGNEAARFKLDSQFLKDSKGSDDLAQGEGVQMILDGTQNNVSRFDASPINQGMTGIGFPVGDVNKSISVIFKADVLGDVIFALNSDSTTSVRLSAATNIIISAIGAATNFTIPSVSIGVYHSLLITVTNGKSARLYFDGVESVSGAQSLTNTFNLDTIADQNTTMSLAFDWLGDLTRVRTFEYCVPEIDAPVISAQDLRA